MADQNPHLKRNRKTAEQRAAEFQRKANKARAQASKQKRAFEARRAIVLGKGLLDLAEGGDLEAQRLVERIELVTSQSEKAAEHSTGPSTAAISHPVTADEWERRIKDAVARHASASDEQKMRIASEWRHAVAGWERCTGKFHIAPEDRPKFRLAGLGEVLADD